MKRAREKAMTDKEESAERYAIVSSYGSLFAVAWRACERSKENGQEAIVAIVFSALAVEGFVNHIAELASRPLAEKNVDELQAFASVMSDLEAQRAQIKTRIQMGYYILTRKTLDRGGLPYQDFSLLVDLRNQLVHSQPEKVEWPPRTDWEPHRLVQQLVARKVIAKPSSSQAPQFQPVICRYEVARWAYNLALDMMNLLINAVPEGEFKETLRFSAANFRPICPLSDP
jgi:hypothetical protein